MVRKFSRAALSSSIPLSPLAELSVLRYMYCTVGSDAARLTACTASQMPIVVVLPPAIAENGSAPVLCSASTILDMSSVSTPSFGSTGVLLPAASSAPSVPKPMMHRITVVTTRPQMTARVIFRKSFILT